HTTAAAMITLAATIDYPNLLSPSGYGLRHQ
ncbi:MAG: hypothetical protein FD167_4787, partial [bacterium]